MIMKRIMTMKLRLIRRFARFLARRGRCWALLDGVTMKPYLYRYCIVGDAINPREPGPWSVYLHNLRSKDPDPFLHNHPWRFSFALILNGGYREVRSLWEDPPRGGERSVWPWSFNSFRRRDVHRISSVEQDTWTVFCTTNVSGNGWGFIMDGTYVPYMEALDKIAASDWFLVDEDGEVLKRAD